MINEKQQAFCEAYVSNGWNGTEAYVTAFKVGKKSAQPSAVKLLSKDYIQDYISSIEGAYKSVAKQYNMDKKFVLKKIKQLMDAKKPIYFKGEVCGETDDFSAQNTAVTTFLKMTGELSPEKMEVVTTEKATDYSKLSEEEQEKLKAEILKTL